MTRWLLAALGVVSVGFGAVGVFVPGLPTTVFLILASACFVRSCPWLERKLLRNRLFAPYMAYVDGGAVMPTRARVAALAMMWVCVTVSATLLAWRGQWGIAAVAVALAGVGSVVIWRWRRPLAASRNGAADVRAR